MTRINSAISPKCLSDEHLLAEHREIKRLPYCLKHSKSLSKIPSNFCLGPGHVTFFLNKFLFLKNRYLEIYNECLKRGFLVTDFSANFENIPIAFQNNYSPTNLEKQLLETRITERIINSKKTFYHFYGKKINKTEAVNLLKNGK